VTQTSGYWTTSGAPSGHQVASYTQAIAAKAWAIIAACAGFEGVAAGYLNSLVGSVPGANTARIGTGGAVVDGQWYKNDAAYDVTIPSAVGGGNTRIDRVVLRVTWASFQCIITRIAGTDAASPTAPAITQTPGTTYDVMLYRALVNTSGAVTLTDERVGGVGLFLRRRGGSATRWATPGTTDYSPVPMLCQAGAALWSPGGSGTGGGITVTFPIPFSNWPLVFVTVSETGVNDDKVLATVSVTGSSSFLIDWVATDSYSHTSITFNWFAIGPA